MSVSDLDTIHNWCSDNILLGLQYVIGLPFEADFLKSIYLFISTINIESIGMMIIAGFTNEDDMCLFALTWL